MTNKTYRALVVTRFGAILRWHHVHAECDDQAIEAARNSYWHPDQGLELWMGNRLVHELKPED